MQCPRGCGDTLIQAKGALNDDHLAACQRCKGIFKVTSSTTPPKASDRPPGLEDPRDKKG